MNKFRAERTFGSFKNFVDFCRIVVWVEDKNFFSFSLAQESTLELNICRLVQIERVNDPRV